MAKCSNCGNEVVLAKVCPYCGARVQQAGDNGPASRVEAEAEPPRRERRRHRAEGEAFNRDLGGPVGPHGWWQWSSTFIKYMFDSRIPPVRKLSVVLMVLYVVSPVDLITDFLPLLGWLDDIGVMLFLSSYMKSELARYYTESRMR